MFTLPRNKGFTLLESAFVIIVAAAIVSMGIKSYSSIQIQKKITVTQQQLTELYHAAIKAPSTVASECGVGKQCLGLPSSTFTNPWGQNNSVSVSGTYFILRTSLPDNSACKTLLQRFSDIQTDADKNVNTASGTCKRNTSNTADKNLEVYISIYQ